MPTRRRVVFVPPAISLQGREKLTACRTAVAADRDFCVPPVPDAAPALARQAIDSPCISAVPGSWHGACHRMAESSDRSAEGRS
jgi:hypothetical protein